MGSLLIVGGGGHGKVIADSACELRRWDRIAFVDDKYPALQEVLDWPVIGKINQTGEFRNSFSDAIVAIGDNRARARIVLRLLAEGFNLPVVINPRAAVSRFAVLGEGTFVMSQAAVNANAIIGKSCIVNTSATVGHDCVLGDFVHVAPGVNIGGEVVVGTGSWVGMGAAIIERVRIGKEIIIGAGAVIIRDVPDGVVVVGVPDSIIKQRIPCDQE